MAINARNAVRAHLAEEDLAACGVWASEFGLNLVIETRVEQFFAFHNASFPVGTVDARQHDALSIALADRSALLVTVGGFWLGLPIRTDRRWADLDDTERTWGELVVSRLSGGYYGLHVHGGNEARFVGGVRDQPIRLEARVELVNGTTAEIIQTTVDYRLEIDGETFFCHDLDDAVRRLGRPVSRIDSDTQDARRLAALVEKGGVLPERSVTINGEEWRRRSALEATATGS
jgi:hypothetical protein